MLMIPDRRTIARLRKSTPRRKFASLERQLAKALRRNNIAQAKAELLRRAAIRLQAKIELALRKAERR